jgi:hypothetical protein
MHALFLSFGILKIPSRFSRKTKKIIYPINLVNPVEQYQFSPPQPPTFFSTIPLFHSAHEGKDYPSGVKSKPGFPSGL